MENENLRISRRKALLSDFIINPNEVRNGREGKTTHQIVYRKDDMEIKTYVLKRIKNDSITDKENFMNEIFHTIQVQENCPSILPISYWIIDLRNREYDVKFNNVDICAVTELKTNNKDKYEQTSMKSFIADVIYDTDAAIMCYGLIRACCLMHHRKLMHLNICPENVLVDDQKHPYIIGFENSTFIGQVVHKDFILKNRDFAPPELLSDFKSPSPKSDIYSVALTIAFYYLNIESNNFLQNLHSRQENSTNNDSNLLNSALSKIRGQNRAFFDYLTPMTNKEIEQRTSPIDAMNDLVSKYKEYFPKINEDTFKNYTKCFPTENVDYISPKSDPIGNESVLDNVFRLSGENSLPNLFNGFFKYFLNDEDNEMIKQSAHSCVTETKNDPIDNNKILIEGKNHEKLKDFKEALNKYSSIMNQNSEALGRYAVLQIRINRNPKDPKFYNYLRIAVSLNDPYSTYFMGYLKMRSEKYKKANWYFEKVLNYFEKSQQTDPKPEYYFDSLFYSGYCLEMIDDENVRAKEKYEKYYQYSNVGQENNLINNQFRDYVSKFLK